MVMSASKNAVVSGSDQTVAFVEPPSSNELDALKNLAISNLELLREFSKTVALQNEKISLLQSEVDFLKQKLALANQHIPEIAARKENLDVLPFTPVSSTCSSGMGVLSMAKLQEQQDIKPKNRRLCQATTKRPNPDPLESNI